MSLTAGDKDQAAARQAEEDRKRKERERQQQSVEQLFQKEDEARQRVRQSAVEAGEAIDVQEDLLSDAVGFNTGEAKRVIGGQFSARNLLRSSIASRGFGEVEKVAREKQAAIKTRAETRRLAVAETARRTFNVLAQEREDLQRRIEQQEKITELKINQAFDVGKIESDFQSHITQLQISEANRAALVGGVADLLRNLTALGFSQNFGGETKDTVPSLDDDFQDASFQNVPTGTL
jgi:hypothetical protein